MKNTLLILAFSFFLACNSEPESKENVVSVDYLLLDNSISKLVKENHRKLSGIKGDLKSFTNYINKLDNDSLSSIPFALDYIHTCIATTDVYRDSIFLLFNIKFYAVANQVSEALDTKYKLILAELDKDSNTAELRSFKNNLKTCGIAVFSSEGTYYLDVISDYFYNNFKNRVSPGVAEFLRIRKDELKEGFSEDAGMLISFEDLYRRVKRWEHFNNQFPNTIYRDEANSFYETYLETLMTGMDNSRVFEFDADSLSPGIKTLYENIIKEEPESPTTKIIAAYYTFLARHDFKENDSIDLFLQANHLSTMLAIQPHSR